MEIIKAEVEGRPHYPEPVKTFGGFYALVSIKEALGGADGWLMCGGGEIEDGGM